MATKTLKKKAVGVIKKAKAINKNAKLGDIDLANAPLKDKKQTELTVDELVGKPKDDNSLPTTDYSKTVGGKQDDRPQTKDDNKTGENEQDDRKIKDESTSFEEPPLPPYNEETSYRSGYGNARYGGNGFRRSSYDERSIPDANLPTEYVEGVLDIANEGSGLLRPSFAASDRDVYISSSQIRRFNLRLGDKVGGQARRPKENERYWGLLKVEKVNGVDAEEQSERATFDDLLPIYPDEQIVLTTGKEPMTTRVIDLIAPIGFGQRGLIVSAPKAGKTWLIKDIIAGIAANYPEGESMDDSLKTTELDKETKDDGLQSTAEEQKGKEKAVVGSPKAEDIKGVHLMAVLIGERPEEVTDIKRHMKTVTNGMGEVAASNFDEPPADQTRVGELALERAKRLVEEGVDVVIVLDSVTRMARAYNLALPNSGRTLSGGFDPVALFPAKKFFGAARKIENGGSLTIIGTCLVDTGSRMDDLIYEEFKGTGNMELHLIRRLADRRVFPAIDVTRSGTRQEELLYGTEILKKIHTLRRMLDMVSDDERTETLLERLSKTDSNTEFLNGLAVG